MPEVFGATGAELRERIGSLAQVVRVDSFIEAEGAARGARRIRVVNGGGIEFELHPDRALDIGQFTVHGVPVAWTSPSGISAPEAYEPDGQGWLRTFGGGLLATCGLDTFGPASEDDGQVLGQHGRVGTQKATITRLDATADGIVVEALIHQAAVFGENLVLRRRISTAAGSDTVRIDDTVTNESFADAPHMILYHMNLGWPLMDDSTTIEVPSHTVTSRDEEAESGLERRAEFGAPVPGFHEQVYLHELDRRSASTVVVTNPARGLEFSLTVSGVELPYLYQWKMQGQGHYVLGVEPANSPNIFGRAAAREAGELPFIPAGESVSYGIEFRVRRIESSAPSAESKDAP
jgi:hypothetical protein